MSLSRKYFIACEDCKDPDACEKAGECQEGCECWHTHGWEFTQESEDRHNDQHRR